MDTPYETTRQPGWPLWWRWTLATATGELLGFAVPALVAPLVVSALGALPEAPRALALLPLVALAGVVEGAVLGYAQWRVLRRTLAAISARAWVLPTALAAGVAYLLGMAPNTLGDLGAGFPLVIAAWVLVYLPLLASIGLAQWTVLRHRLPRAGWWVPANAVAWLAGLPLTIVGIGLVPDGSSTAAYIAAGVASGWLMAAVVGAITGLALVRMLRAAGPWPGRS